MMTQSNPKKYIFNNIISWIIIACMMSTLSLLIYWMFFPIQVMDICETKIITPKVKPGQFFIYELKYNKHLDIPGDIDRRLVDHISIPLISHEGFRREMGKNISQVHVWIPNQVPPGTYRLHTTISYDINPMRTVRVSYNTPQFEVTNGK